MSLGKRRKDRPRGRFWGHADWDFRDSIVIEEMCDEAVIVLANLQAQKRGFRDHDDAIPLSYNGGPYKRRPASIAKGLFTLIRLGVVSIAEPSVLSGGTRRTTRYAIVRKWIDYDPSKPGLFLLQEPSVSPAWKRCFNPDGTWADGIKPKIAPRRRAAAPAD